MRYGKVAFRNRQRNSIRARCTPRATHVESEKKAQLSRFDLPTNVLPTYMLYMFRYLWTAAYLIRFSPFQNRFDWKSEERLSQGCPKNI